MQVFVEVNLSARSSGDSCDLFAVSWLKLVQIDLRVRTCPFVACGGKSCGDQDRDSGLSPEGYLQ